MKRYRMLLLIAAIPFFQSCTDGWRLNRKEDRIAGEWIIEQAFFRENRDLFRENVRREFYGDRLTFYRDYTVTYDDAQTRNFYPGEWQLFVERRYYDDESDIEFYIDMFFYDRDGRVAFSWNGEVTTLTYNRLNLRVNDRAGVYTFRLRRR